MAKIELDIPDNWLKFIRKFNAWSGEREKSDIAGFILSAIRPSIECQLDYVHAGAPKRAVALVKKYGLQDQCTFRRELVEESA